MTGFQKVWFFLAVIFFFFVLYALALKFYETETEHDLPLDASSGLRSTNANSQREDSISGEISQLAAKERQAFSNAKCAGSFLSPEGSSSDTKQDKYLSCSLDTNDDDQHIGAVPHEPELEKIIENAVREETSVSLPLRDVARSHVPAHHEGSVINNQRMPALFFLCNRMRLHAS